jgi:hypothetical protein
MIADVLQTVKTALEDWVRRHRGSVEIAGDQDHLFALLEASPGFVRASIMLRREAKRGEYEEAGMIDLTFIVVISRGRGFSATTSDTLVKDTSLGAPLFTVAEEARDVVRSITFPEKTEQTANYMGMDLFEFPLDRPVDAYQLTFTLGCQMPAATPSEE